MDTIASFCSGFDTSTATKVASPPSDLIASVTRLPPLLVEVGDNDLCAGASKGEGAGFSDPGASAGHYRHLAVVVVWAISAPPILCSGTSPIVTYIDG